MEFQIDKTKNRSIMTGAGDLAFDYSLSWKNEPSTILNRSINQNVFTIVRKSRETERFKYYENAVMKQVAGSGEINLV
jgi:hypothetical protein